MPRNPLLEFVRPDLAGRFNEVDVLRRQWNRIRAGSEGIIVPPFEVLIHPSSACNILCVWCIGDHIPLNANGKILDASKQNPNRLPDNLRDPEKMRRLIQGIVDYRRTIELDGTEIEFKVENVQFSGLIGEPLASKKALLEVIPLLVENGIRTGIFTNAILIDKACVSAFQLIDYVNVSLDAAKPETYDLLKTRRPGSNSFAKILDNIEQLTQAATTSASSRLRVNSSFVIYPENYEEVFAAAALLKERGVSSLKFKQDISGKRILNADQVNRVLSLLDKIDDELVDENFQVFRIHKPGRADEGERRFSRCRITDLMAAVGSDGHLYPCNYHPRPNGATYGSAIDHPFEEIWEHSRRLALRSKLPTICPSVCDPFKNRANALLETLDQARESVEPADVRRMVNEAIDIAGLEKLQP